MLALSALVFLALSCKPKQIIVDHTQYVYKTRIDSFRYFVHDSVSVRQKGDTIFVEKWKTTYRDRTVTKTDTIRQKDIKTVTVTQTKTVIKEVPVRDWVWYSGLIVLILAGAYIAWRLLLKNRLLNTIQKVSKTV